MSSKKTKTQTAPIRRASESHTGRESFLALSPKVFGALAIILIATLLCYLPLFDNDFVNWDDDKYIYDNPLIRDLNFKAFFSQYVMGHYHPFVITAYALIYKVFGLNPDAYHAVNLLFHLANTALVFFVFMALAQKMEIAFVVSLLFGIHPLHVESVAWASELKDVMYAFFFLLSWWFYIQYLHRERQKKYYFLSLLFFLCSLLSKAMGVSLVGVIILTDVFKERRIAYKTLIEKIPFGVLGLIFGLLAIISQHDFQAIQESSAFKFPDRLLFASYGFIAYLWKIFFPIKLSPYYPYPLDTTEGLPIIFYVSPILLLFLIALTFYSVKFNRRLVFGLGFYAITVALVLQLLPVGNVIMANRYTYIPSLGMFYLISIGLMYLKEKQVTWGYYLLLLIIAFSYCILTRQQVKTWKDGLTLWSYAISQNCFGAVPYSNLANALDKQDDYTGALANYTKAIEYDSNYLDIYVYRGVVKAKLNDYEGAIADFNSAIRIDSTIATPYFYRANAHTSMQNFPLAIQDLNKAININPQFAPAYYNSAIINLQIYDYKGAIKGFDKSIELNQELGNSYINRGNAKLMLGDYNGAIYDLTKALEYQNSSNPLIYNNRGIAKYNIKDFQGAIQDYNNALEINPQYVVAYVNRGNAKSDESDIQGAIRDYTIAIELDNEYGEAYYKRATLNIKTGAERIACDDLAKASSLGFTQASVLIARHCRR